MKTLPLRPIGLAALCGFVSTTLSARDFPAFPDAPHAYGDAVSLHRARDLQFPENAAVFKSAVREMTLSSGYFSSFRDPNHKPTSRIRNDNVGFDFSTGKWIDSRNGQPLRDVLVPWGDRYVSIDRDGHGTIFTETEDQKKTQADPQLLRLLRHLELQKIQRQIESRQPTAAGAKATTAGPTAREASVRRNTLQATETVPLSSLTRNASTGEWTDASGRVRTVIASNDDYDFAVVIAIDEGKLKTPEPIASGVWLEPPPIPTPKADAVRESQGEPRTPAEKLRQSQPKARELVYPVEDRDFAPKPAGPPPTGASLGASGIDLLSDEEIRIWLQPEVSTNIWEARRNAARAMILGGLQKPAAEAGSDTPGFSSIDALAPILSRHRVVDPNWVTVGTEEPTTRRHPDWLHAPTISTPKTDKVRQSLGEGLEPGFEPSVTPNPIPLKLETINVLGAAAETAAGFPGEVIDEVIVPVPSEIFLVLDKLGKPDWKGQLRSGKQPSLTNRIDVALLLGNVVAEGFVAVQAEDRSAVEQIGKDVLRLSESLGLKETVLPHTNSILEASKHSHWEIVRVELDKTQKTVRDTMEQHRDSELAQCVSLGGWLRGTEAVTDLINKNYTSDSAELLNQPDIIRHFQKELKKLAAKNQKLKNMLAGLEAIAVVIGTGDEPPNADGVQSIHTTTAKLVKSIATPSK